MSARATTVFRGNLGAFLVASAIALLPAHVLKTAVVAGVRYAAALPSNAGPVVRQPEERQGRFRDEVGTTTAASRPPSAAPRSEGIVEAIRDLPELPDRHTAILDAILICAVLPLLASGVYLALAALTPMIAARREGGRLSAAQAWDLVGARFGELVRTAALAAVLTLVGLLFLALPGVALAVGFAFALPAVLVEGQSGIGALSRSLALSVRVMPRLLGIAVLFPLFRIAAALAAGLLLPRAGLVPRLLLADAISVVLFPLPIAALAVLFDEARRAAPPHAAPRRRQPRGLFELDPAAGTQPREPERSP